MVQSGRKIRDTLKIKTDGADGMEMVLTRRRCDLIEWCCSSSGVEEEQWLAAAKLIAVWVVYRSGGGTVACGGGVTK